MKRGDEGDPWCVGKCTLGRVYTVGQLGAEPPYQVLTYKGPASFLPFSANSLETLQ